MPLIERQSRSRAIQITAGTASMIVRNSAARALSRASLSRSPPPDAARLLCADPFHAESKLAANRDGEFELGIRENMGSVVVGHELADELPAGNQRDECERADPFRFDRRPKRFIKIGTLDVIDADGLGVLGIRRPGRVSVNGPAVASDSPRQATNRITPASSNSRIEARWHGSARRIASKAEA